MATRKPRSVPPRRKRAVMIAAAVLVLAGGLWAWFGAPRDYLRAASLAVRAAGLEGGWADWIAAFDTGPVAVSDLDAPTRHGAIRARLYQPERGFSRTVILTPGVHRDGVDEARLVKLARDLSASGLAVLTIELPDLCAYRITARLPDQIEDAAAWAADREDLAPDGRVTLMGISFAGGLSVVAAGREAVRDRIAQVVSFGGYGDFPRTLRYLCTGIEPDGALRPPHDYGVAVILLNAAEHMVPPEQVEGLRAGILAFLRASSLDRQDQPAAEAEFARAAAIERQLGEPAASLLRHVNARDVEPLGAALLPVIEQFAGDPPLSPERSPVGPAAVLLLHGAGDNVIPAAESVILARDLAARGTPVRLLVTPLITHAEIERAPTAGEAWELIRFLAKILED